MKKKILHVLSSSQYSGAENIAMSLINNLTNEYDLLYVSPDGPIKEMLKERNVNFVLMEEFSILNLRNVIKMWRPDIVHAHDFTATLKCVLASLNIPVISHIHQNPSWLKSMNLKSLVFYLFCLKISHIVVVTPSILESTLLSSLFKDKTSVIENIADIEYIYEKSCNTNNEYYDVAFIGRLVDVKNPIRFINIIDKIAKKRPTIKAVMVGDGKLREKCANIIRHKNLEDNITLKGYVDNPFPILKNSKVLVMTSKSEGLPMTLIEALILGKPVIVSQIDGVDEIVDETCGVVCSNDDEYVYSVLKLLEDDSMYSYMSRNAKLKAQTKFNMKEYTEKFIQVYENIN